MKLIELRKDGHTAYVKKSQVVWMLSQGWDLAPNVKARRC